MATWQHLRSSTANKRPTTSLADGRIAINTNTASPGLFFKDSAGTGIVKVGPVHVGTTAPNSVPASGGSSGNYTGEQWLDTSVSPAQMKVWNGSTWVGIVADELPVSKLQDGAARQLIQTDAAGTGVEWTSNVDVPGTLDVTSTATFDSIAQHPLGTAGAPTITFSGDTNTGFYSPGADQVAISTNGTGRLFVDANGNVGVGGAASANGLLRLNAAYGLNANLIFSENNTDRYLLGQVTGDNALRVFDLFANSERLRIDSSGRLGLGTSSPSTTLSVAGGISGTAGMNISGAGWGVLPYVANSLVIDNNAGEARFFATGANATTRGSFIFYNGETDGGAGAAMVIDTSSRVGIGTTAAGARLHVFGGNAYVGGDWASANYESTARTLKIESNANNSGYFVQAAYDSASTANTTFYRSSVTAANGGSWILERGAGNFNTNSGNPGSFTECLRVDASSRLLVGTSTALNFESGLTVIAQQTNGGAGIAHIRNSSASSADGSPCLVLSKTSTTTSSSARFIQFAADNDAVPMGGIVGNGASNVQFASLSDIRDKENIQALTGALDKIKQLEVVSYNWKRSKEHVKAGFIAQNVETIFPEYVVENIAPEGAEPRKGITGGLSSGYTAVLTAALQEAIIKIETLEAKVAALEGM